VRLSIKGNKHEGNTEEKITNMPSLTEIYTEQLENGGEGGYSTRPSSL
jgi:hypothetical protein